MNLQKNDKSGSYQNYFCLNKILYASVGELNYKSTKFEVYIFILYFPLGELNYKSTKFEVYIFKTVLRILTDYSNNDNVRLSQ